MVRGSRSRWNSGKWSRSDGYELSCCEGWESSSRGHEGGSDCWEDLETIGESWSWGLFSNGGVPRRGGCLNGGLRSVSRVSAESRENGRGCETRDLGLERRLNSHLGNLVGGQRLLRLLGLGLLRNLGLLRLLGLLGLLGNLGLLGIHGRDRLLDTQRGRGSGLLRVREGLNVGVWNGIYIDAVFGFRSILLGSVLLGALVFAKKQSCNNRL